MATAKKSGSKKASSKKAAPGNKYAPAASKNVEREMKAMHEGKLKSGNSNKKVTNPKQAIAIALSEARRAGADVPQPPSRSASAQKAGATKTAAKKAPAKKAAGKKAAGKTAAKD